MRVLGVVEDASRGGVDVALVDFGQDGDTLWAALVGVRSVPYDGDLRGLLAQTAPPARLTYEDICVLDTRLGQTFAEAAVEMAGAAGPVDLVCSAGRTVVHWVEDGAARGMLQLGQPAWIAERLGVPVVADVAARDIAAGGQGVPLASCLDVLVLRAVTGRPAALDLGAVAGVTVLHSPVGPLAYDIGAAGALIDAVITWGTGGDRTVDLDGRIAATGTVDEILLTELLAERYYFLPPLRGVGTPSAGEVSFNLADVDRALAGREAPLPDLAATVTALSAEVVARDIRERDVDVLVTSGGGTRNPTLIRMLRDRLPGVRLVSARRLRVPSQAKFAAAVALIGWLTAHGLPATLPGCTGARGARVLGAITPGAGQLRLPKPLGVPPRALRFE